MSKFKVGDKVRPIKSRMVTPDWTQFDGATVTSIGTRFNQWPIAIRSASGVRGLADESELELIRPKRDYVADHARRTLRKAGLPKDVAAKVVRNVTLFDLSNFSRKLPVPASGVISGGFDWATSPEGVEYWSREHDEQIAREVMQYA